MCAQVSEMAPKWAAGLHQVGLYFEGFANYDEPAVLEEYYKETVTSFGVHNSSRCHSLLCDYHHEQEWEMWIKDRKHGPTSEEADQLLAELRACAFASVTKNQYGTSNIQKCGKITHVFSSWLSTTWLSISQIHI